MRNLIWKNRQTLERLLPQSVQPHDLQSELTLALKTRANRLEQEPNLPLGTLTVRFKSDATEEISRILTERQRSYRDQVHLIKEHIDSISRKIQLSEGPEAFVEAITHENTFTKNQLKLEMLLDQNKVLSPPRGIVSEDRLEAAEALEAQIIKSAKEQADLSTQQILEARHPQQPMISPRSFTGIVTLIFLLVFCLDGILARTLNLTQIELVMLIAADICLIIGSTIIVRHNSTESIIKQETPYESEPLRAAS